MPNMQDFVAGSPYARKLAVDELLFAEFKCPMDEKTASIWWHNNFFAHVLSGETVMKTPKGEYRLKAGDSAFAKKGSVLTYNHVHEDFCELLIFVPDEFIRTVVRKYKTPLTAVADSRQIDTVIPLATDEVLESYFRSLFSHFRMQAPPAGTLLRLKFEELLLDIFSSNRHNELKCYFSEVCRSSKPSIQAIMEANFFSRLPLEEFARLCARSLSAFKKEFKHIYNTTPGKWLLEKRLEYSHYLLETTDLNIDQICTESGFENQTHFIRVFKNRYGQSPGRLKMRKVVSVPS